MLDPRIYRAGLVPVLLAAIIAAFSIETPPRPLAAGLPPDSFSGERAYAGLRQLAARYPDRSPGGAGDAGLARLVSSALRGDGFGVTVRRFEARTARGRRELVTVTGRRVGLSRRQIVVLASRDALQRPATAQLSGTAGLLELARVFEGRTLRKTLVLVSTSGGSGGGAGAAEAAGHLTGPVDAVLVLGDLGGREVRRPIVVPWADDRGIAPPALRATVGAAVRQETGRRAGDPGLLAQFARLAFPLTVGEQGPLGAAGLPAVMLSVSGERGPVGGPVASSERFEAFGRATLRSITALDAREPVPRAPRAELYAQRKLLPGWAVRLLVAALILPAALAAIDGFARMRRRRHPVGMWIAWVLAGALPFALAFFFAWVLSIVGLMPTPPPAAAPVGALPLNLGAGAVMASVILVAIVGWLALRPAALRLGGVSGDPDSPGAAAALALVLVAAVVAAWAFNPFAAALLLPAVHGWMLLAAPEVRVQRTAALALVALTLLPVGVIVLYYGLALGADPLSLAWNGLLWVVGGQVGLPGAISWCVLLGCLGSVLAVVRSKRFEAPVDSEPTIRGPLSYAGPGSLGGTESALRR